jgi:hypothetical protein
MSDIIREVDEELRHERMMKLWERYGVYVVAAALVLVLAVGGWRAWEWYTAREAARSGAQFEAAIRLANEGKTAEAQSALDALADEGTRGYRILARFRAAAETAKTDKSAGVKAYDALAADSSIEQPLRDIARLQAGLLVVDTASPAEVSERMAPLLQPASPFRHSARELVGLAQYRAGDRTAAAKTFAELLADQELPPAMRTRAQIMSALLAGETGAAAAAGAATQ